MLDGSGTAAVPPRPKLTELDGPPSDELLAGPLTGPLPDPPTMVDDPPPSDPAIARPLATGLPEASEAAMVTVAGLVAVPPMTSALWII